jgi:hypothetical protein
MGGAVFGNQLINGLKGQLLKLAQPELSKIHKFKDIHKGEDGYLFGSGSSLKWFDLQEFSSKVSIASYVLPFHRSFSDLNVKYLLPIESFWFYPRMWTEYVTNGTSMPHISKSIREIIQANPDKQFFTSLSNFPVIRSSNIYYLFLDIVDARLPDNFISHRINAFTGHFRASITMAIYMGFDHIYLVGYDYTHVPSRSKHWYEKGQGVFRPQVDYQKDFFEIAKEFIDITTITLDGTSDFINAVTYKEHTGREPMYRENTELVDEKYLKALATWQGYTIY